MLIHFFIIKYDKILIIALVIIIFFVNKIKIINLIKFYNRYNELIDEILA